MGVDQVNLGSSSYEQPLEEARKDHRDVQERWYAAARIVVASGKLAAHDEEGADGDGGEEDSGNDDEDVEMLDASRSMKTTTGTTATTMSSAKRKKSKGKSKSADKEEEKPSSSLSSSSLYTDESFDPNDPRPWELRYVYALLKSCLS